MATSTELGIQLYIGVVRAAERDAADCRAIAHQPGALHETIYVRERMALRIYAIDCALVTRFGSGAIANAVMKACAQEHLHFLHEGGAPWALSPPDLTNRMRSYAQATLRDSIWPLEIGKAFATNCGRDPHEPLVVVAAASFFQQYHNDILQMLKTVDVQMPPAERVTLRSGASPAASKKGSDTAGSESMAGLRTVGGAAHEPVSDSVAWRISQRQRLLARITCWAIAGLLFWFFVVADINGGGVDEAVDVVLGIVVPVALVGVTFILKPGAR